MFSVSLILRTRDSKRRGRNRPVVSPSNYISTPPHRRPCPSYRFTISSFPIRPLSRARSFEFTRASRSTEGSNARVSGGEGKGEIRLAMHQSRGALNGAKSLDGALSPLTVGNDRTARLTAAPRESDTATVSYSLNAAITRSSMPLHPDLLDKHLSLLSRLPILNPLSWYLRFDSASRSGEVERMEGRNKSEERVVGNCGVCWRNISGRVVAPRLKPRKPGNDQLNETSSALMHSLPAGITYGLYDSRNYPQITQLVPMCALPPSRRSLYLPAG